MVERATLELAQHLTPQDIALYATALSALAMAFRKEVRYEVRRRQRNLCDSCFEKSQLQTHHRIPESRGGSSRDIENAVGLCQDCHRVIDEETFSGNVYPQVHTQSRYFPQGNGLNSER